jgi:hypothetical protein
MLCQECNGGRKQELKTCRRRAERRSWKRREPRQHPSYSPVAAEAVADGRRQAFSQRTFNAWDSVLIGRGQSKQGDPPMTTPSGAGPQPRLATAWGVWTKVIVRPSGTRECSSLFFSSVSAASMSEVGRGIECIRSAAESSSQPKLE